MYDFLVTRTIVLYVDSEAIVFVLTTIGVLHYMDRSVRSMVW